MKAMRRTNELVRRSVRSSVAIRPNLKKQPMVVLGEKKMEELEAPIQIADHIAKAGMRLGVLLLSHRFHVVRGRRLPCSSNG